MKISPCPFFHIRPLTNDEDGRYMLYVAQWGRDGYAVNCRMCDAWGPSADSIGEAVRSENHTALIQAAQAVLVEGV